MKTNFMIPKIPLSVRMIIFAACETGGILIQAFFPSLFLLSLVIMVGGAILIVARNYQNKPMDLGFEDWKPASKTEFERIEQNLKMTKKISYPFIYKGGFGVVILVILGIIAFFAFVEEAFGILILVLDFARQTDRIIELDSGRVAREHVVGDPFDEDWKVLRASALGQALLTGSRPNLAVSGVPLCEDGQLTEAGRFLREMMVQDGGIYG